MTTMITIQLVRTIFTAGIMASLLMTQTLAAKDLATVDGTVISVESVMSALRALGPQGEMVVSNPELKKRFVDHLVNSLLVAKRARSEGFDKSNEFKKRLADMTNQLLAGEYMDAVIAKKTSEKSLRTWFNENQARFSKQEVHALHILCESETTAAEALKEAQKNPSEFAAVAKKYSRDKTIDLGFFGRGRMLPEFEHAAFSTPAGTIYKTPVKTSFGWHVIKVLETRGEKSVSFDSVKSDVAKKYRQKLQEELIHELREKSKIAINEQSLKDIKLP